MQSDIFVEQLKCTTTNFRIDDVVVAYFRIDADSVKTRRVPAGRDCYRRTQGDRIWNIRILLLEGQEFHERSRPKPITMHVMQCRFAVGEFFVAD